MKMQIKKRKVVSVKIRVSTFEKTLNDVEQNISQKVLLYNIPDNIKQIISK